MGAAMLTIMAAIAQLERDTMIERTRAGLAAAAANGRKGLGHKADVLRDCLDVRQVLISHSAVPSDWWLVEAGS